MVSLGVCLYFIFKKCNIVNIIIILFFSLAHLAQFVFSSSSVNAKKKL